jgi:plasmid stabilization system protein ParE
MTYSVILLTRAKHDVATIQNWIAERSPSGATKWFNSFVAALKTLENNPYGCELAPEDQVVGRGIRQLLFRTRKGHRYRILFTVENDIVHVVHVRAPGQPLVSPDQF